MEVLAFASFATLVLAWVIAPTDPRVPRTEAAVDELKAVEGHLAA